MTAIGRIALGIAAAMAVFTGCERSPTTLHMSTTTSVENSGLLGVILPQFQREAGIEVLVVAVGSGRALAILERGDSDVALTHDPEAERAVVGRGSTSRYRKIMYNDFVIAGPAADPAGVKSAGGALEAMHRIAAAPAVSFASRADSSGTHSRELQLWREAGVRPAAGRLIETGSGMGATLRVASERQSYLLTDRATFLQLAPSLRLTILNEGDPRYLNTYAIMIRAGLTGARAANAERLFLWFTEGAGRDRISAFTIAGQPAFTIWPAGAPRDRPDDLPNAR